MYFKFNLNSVTSCVAMSIILATLITGGEGLKINNLAVPKYIQNGTQTSVVLDCDYSFDDDYRDGLLVKWYHKGNDEPVYQWIHKLVPQDLGLLKGKLNLNYRASEDEHKRHRALEILNPTHELSGEYKCVVSTYEKEDSEAKTMIIYVPGKNLVVTATKQDDDSVNITCAAEDVYPQPQLVIVGPSGTKSNHSFAINQTNGLFGAFTSLVVDDDSIEADSVTFECKLDIPNTNYTISEPYTYFPGPPTTMTPEPPTSEMPESNPVDSNTSCRVALSWLLMLTLALCLRL